MDGPFHGGSSDITGSRVKPRQPARESLVSDIPAGDGKITNLFLKC
jgi:hypothetical protein